MTDVMIEPEPEIDWWLIIRIPDEMHIHQMGLLDSDELSVAIGERTSQHGVPEGWWAYPGSGYDVSLSIGEPHPQLLGAATTVTRLEEAA